MLARNFNAETFSFIELSWRTFYYIFLAILMMGIRDLAYIYRLIVLTDNRLSWKQAFNIIMLWEFSSAVSPSVVGGTGPAIFFLYKEGLSGGRSTAVVLTAIFLDEVFFILSVPIVYLIYGSNIFPPDSVKIDEIIFAFYFGYILILIYNPGFFKHFQMKHYFCVIL